jgi:Flp pilus assembly protein TadD
MVTALAEKGQDPKITSGVYNNMAIGYAVSGRKEAADAMFMKSIEKARVGGLRDDEFQFLWTASKFYAEEHNYEKVSELQERAQRLYPNSLRFDQYPWNDSN